MTEEVTREEILAPVSDQAKFEQRLAEAKEAIKDPVVSKEELTEELPAVEVKEEVTPSREYTEIEKQAMAQGWKPADQLEPGKKFVDAEEYIDRGPIIKRIQEESKARKREAYEYKKELAELKKQIAESRAAGYEEALREVEKLRTEAVSFGDIEAFKKHDDHRQKLEKDLQATRAEIQHVEPEPELPEIEDFKIRNADWLNHSTEENKRMTLAAQAASNLAAVSKPGITPAEELEFVEKEVARLFPHRFKNEKKVAPSPVARADDGRFVSTHSGSKLSYHDLNPMQKKACESLLKLDPTATVDTYLKGLEQAYKRRDQIN